MTFGKYAEAFADVEIEADVLVGADRFLPARRSLQHHARGIRTAGWYRDWLPKPSYKHRSQRRQEMALKQRTTSSVLKSLSQELRRETASERADGPYGGHPAVRSFSEKGRRY